MSDVLVQEVSGATDDTLKVIEGVELTGRINTSEEQIAANIASAIRRGHPQLRPQDVQTDRICLVGGGPSLADTESELVELLRDGAKLVTVNGAYHWALAHNLHPKTQVVMDARPENARFVEPAVPGCNYLLASQCHPATWDAVEGRERVFIMHTVRRDESHAALLDDYYLKQWQTVNGGSTVTSRALVALRLMGYLRFDLFGVDCCWTGDQHHAYPQPENEQDRRYRVRVAPSDAPDYAREFHCSAWHLKQYEDFLKVIKANGSQFLLHVHGDGLLAYTIRTNAALVDQTEA